MIYYILLAAAVIILFHDVGNALILLSDLPTPSFIIDTQALYRRMGPILSDEEHGSSKIFAPSIRCPNNKLILNSSINDEESNQIIDCDFNIIEGQPSIGYLHSSVLRGRDDANEDDASLTTFLAEIDLDPNLCSEDAQLVLGLNNHHVGGYYWARSAGVGSSMEAPGVSFTGSSSNKNGLLCWKNKDGPTECNSNDGKRSEWCNFLRKGDQVQLVPRNGQETLLQFSKQFAKQSPRVFGISTQGRPMGSEPECVCEWKFDQLDDDY